MDEELKKVTDAEFDAYLDGYEAHLLKSLADAFGIKLKEEDLPKGERSPEKDENE